MDTLPTRWVKVSHHTPAHLSGRYPYAAYGSNLMLAQIAARCPHAEVLGKGKLRGARLAFARVATIIVAENVDVLIGAYKLTADDIEKLDRKEGLGKAYERYLVTVEIDGEAVRCFTYIRVSDRPEAPSEAYYARLAAGYKDWDFSDRRLRRARERAVREAAKLPPVAKPSLLAGRDWFEDLPLRRPPSQARSFYKGHWGRWAYSGDVSTFIPDDKQPVSDDSTPRVSLVTGRPLRNAAAPEIYDNPRTGERWRRGDDGVYRRLQ